MTAPAQTAIGPEERATLAALADALVPAAGNLPAASEVGAADRWLDRALAALPELEPHLARVLAGARGRDPADALRRLHAEDPEGFQALTLAVTGAYYMHPRVRRRIGYPGQVSNPPFPDEAEYYIEGLLEPLLAQGPRSKPAPEETAPAPLPKRRNGKPRADVLVIGAGAAGSVAAKHLAEAGFKVTCLEQGGWLNASDFPGDKLEFELLIRRRWNADPNLRAQPEDYPCETSAADVAPVMFNAVGGSTIHFGAQWARMRPVDFRVRSIDGVADDWPISYEELRPHYERLDVELNVSGTAGDPAYPPGPAPPLAGLSIGKIGRKAAQGMNELGWHWWPAAHSIPSREIGRQKQCARRGTCMFGCPEGAKGSTDLTVWPDALKAGARLVTGARVRHITVGPDGLATGAVYVDREGNEQREEADVVVVAANGIGTPRLLLLSGSPRFPDGLANSSGLVGKRLMLHPYMSVLGIYEEDLESWLGPAGTPLLSLQFADTDPGRGFARGAQWDLLPTWGVISQLERFDSLPFDQRWGEAIHGLVEKTIGHAFDWGIGIEDLPNEAHTVTLDPQLADSDGIPAPKITYRIDDDARANLQFQLARAREAHEAAGARETLVTDWSQWGWHLLGTARMGDDPERSVVDRWGRAHDVPNLYVIDGSVFVTSGPQPPTATIAANALRCTEHLIATAGTQATPG